MSFSDCQGASSMSVSWTCPLSLQPCWNHSPLTLVFEKKKKQKKRSHSREHCHAILGGFISDLTWGKQPGVNTSSPTLTRCTCSKFNSQSYGFECGTAWVSEFLSFDFTQYETQGLNLPGRATQHPGWGLILCAVSFAVVHIVRARGVFSQMPPPQPDTVCISSAVFFFPAKKKKKKTGTRQGHSLFFG